MTPYQLHLEETALVETARFRHPCLDTEAAMLGEGMILDNLPYTNEELFDE